FNDPSITLISTLSLHDALPIYHYDHSLKDVIKVERYAKEYGLFMTGGSDFHGDFGKEIQIGNIICPTNDIEPLLTRYNHCKNSLDRKSTRLNSSHVSISYAVFC